jgi:hypothetical protein
LTVQRPKAICSKISVFTLSAFADVASEATSWSKIKYAHYELQKEGSFKINNIKNADSRTLS